jgi:hypothetical protein
VNLGLDKELANSERNVKINTRKATPVLDELSVQSATGDIRNIYEAIQTALGVKLVNLVYRHLATVPGALEWAWGTVGPSFTNGIFAERAIGLGISGDILSTESVSLKQSGLSLVDGDGVVDTLDAYNRANPMNMLSLRVLEMALEAGRPAISMGSVSADVRPPNMAGLTALLPMAPLNGLPPTTMDILNRLAGLTTGKDSGLVPSFFRHFTAWPALLEALANWLETMAEQGVIERQVEGISAKVDAIAADIFDQLDRPEKGAVLPNKITRATLLQTIEIFPPAICRMIVIGGLLRAAVRP